MINILILNIIQLNEPTMYLEKIDPKVKSMIAESNNELEQRFSKEELEGILHSYETDELPEHPITKEETVRVLRDMYENQSYYKLR